MTGGETATIICALIAALASVLVAVIETRNVKDRKRAEHRSARRAEESRLSMELMSATCELSVVTATALRDGHTNGTLEPALEAANKAQSEYRAWLLKEASQAVAKV